MRVLVVTNMLPVPAHPSYGVFVRDQVDDLRSLGVDVDVLFVDGRRSRLNYARAAASLRARLRHEPFDIVHAHYGLTGAVAISQRRTPVVTTFHGSDANGESPWQTWVSRLVVRRSTAIVVSRHLRDALGRPDAVVIPAAVDVDAFVPMDRAAARRSLGWRLEPPYVLFPGARSVHRKRADLFDAAVEHARRTHPDLRSVSLEGLPREEVVLTMNAADVLVMTSDREGAPVAVREALACTTPVVSVPVGDVPDVLRGLPSCAIVPRAPEALGDAIVASLGAERTSELRDRALESGRLRVAERVVAVYEHALGRS
jgi:glycosyltransferase involved in cell wall biosynthesis